MTDGFDKTGLVPPDLPEDPAVSYRPPSAAASANPAMDATVIIEPKNVAEAADAGRQAFVLKRKVGSGTYGEVWEALQLTLNRVVAVKRPKIDPDEEPRTEASKKVELLFQKEALITGRLDHPNIVPVYDLGQDLDGRPLLAMKLVGGSSWDELLTKDKSSSLADKLARHLPILMQAGQAVAFAHDRGILHRDIKPAQVMVGNFGEVFLMDWGLAVSLPSYAAGGLTPTARFAVPVSEAPNPAGTLAFMAPEQTESSTARLGPWTDIFLLGGILYYIITETFPHPQPRSTAAFQHAARGIVEPPEERAPDREIPRELSRICRKAMAREIGDRYSSVQEFIQAIEDYISGAGRKDESRRLTVQARELFESGPHDYANLGKCDTLLVRALNLWDDNGQAAALHDDVLEAYVHSALARGDRKLAKAQAQRVGDEAAQTGLIEVVEAAEKKALRHAAQRRMAISSTLFLTIMSVVLILVMMKSHSDAVAEQTEIRMNTERLIANREVVNRQFERAAEDTALYGRLSNLQSGTTRYSEIIERELPIPNSLKFEDDWSADFLTFRKDLRDEMTALRSRIYVMRDELSTSGLVSPESYRMLMGNGILELYEAGKGQDTTKALESFRKAAAEAPERFEPLQCMAIAVARAGDPDTAVDYLNQASRRTSVYGGVANFARVQTLRSAAMFEKAKSVTLADDDIVIESWPGGKNSENYKEQGSWGPIGNKVESKSVAPGLSHYKQSGCRQIRFYEPFKKLDTNMPAYARFLPRFEKERRCHVYITWAGDCNAVPVYLTVKHAGGSKTVAVVQDGMGIKAAPTSNYWISLGEFDFSAGENQYVEVRVTENAKPVSPQRFAQAIADSVLFTSTQLTAFTTPLPLVDAEPMNPDGQPTLTQYTTTAEPRWAAGLDEGLARARQEGKKAFVFVYYPIGSYFVHPLNRFRDYCENRLLCDPDIANIVSENFVPIRLDLSENDVMKRIADLHIGTGLYVCDVELKPLASWSGEDLLMSPREFSDKLTAIAR